MGKSTYKSFSLWKGKVEKTVGEEERERESAEMFGTTVRKMVKGTPGAGGLRGEYCVRQNTTERGTKSKKRKIKEKEEKQELYNVIRDALCVCVC